MGWVIFLIIFHIALLFVLLYMALCDEDFMNDER